MALEAVLFDMYGTLGVEVDYDNFTPILIEHGFEPDVAHEIRHAADMNAFDGVVHPNESASREAYMDWTRSKIVDALIERGTATSDAHELADKYDDWVLGFHQSMQAYAETRSVLEQLRSRGYRLAVCSNWTWDILDVVADLGIGDLVEGVYSSAQLGARKPSPVFFDKVMDLMGLEPQYALFVGDTWSSDIEGATSVGMRSVFVDRAGKGAIESRDDVYCAPDLNGVMQAVDLFRRAS